MRRHLSLLAGVVSLALTCVSAKATVTSTFDTDADGWTHAPGGDTDSTVTYSHTGGNPGGAVVLSDAAEGNTDYFLAPSKYLGNDSSAYGGTLSFDLKDTLAYAGGANVIEITGNVGQTLTYDTGAFAANTWDHATAVLTESSGWMLGGTAPTQSQFQAILGSVTSLEILGDFTAGNDTTTLDNVNLPTVPEPVGLGSVLIGGAFTVLGRRRGS